MVEILNNIVQYLRPRARALVRVHLCIRASVHARTYARTRTAR